MISDGCLRGILARGAAERLKTYFFNHYFFQQQAKNEQFRKN
jgi:hypothetical protein